MAIYPVIKGQKPKQQNVIPPRASHSGPSTPSKDSHNGEGNLTGSAHESPAPHQPPLKEEAQPSSESRPPLDPAHSSTAEVQELLASTGKRAQGGPLIDFHGDMKKDLPNSAKRTDSIGSEDNFVDAEG